MPILRSAFRFSKGPNFKLARRYVLDHQDSFLILTFPGYGSDFRINPHFDGLIKFCWCFKGFGVKTYLYFYTGSFWFQRCGLIKLVKILYIVWLFILLIWNAYSWTLGWSVYVWEWFNFFRIFGTLCEPLCTPFENLRILLLTGKYIHRPFWRLCTCKLFQRRYVKVHSTRYSVSGQTRI